MHAGHCIKSVKSGNPVFHFPIFRASDLSVTLRLHLGQLANYFFKLHTHIKVQLKSLPLQAEG
jgi:hypothetical protein